LSATAYANHLTATYGMTANYIALGIFTASWIAQFIGHGVFEGRAPALLDNLVQALFLAPFFVWMEVSRVMSCPLKCHPWIPVTQVNGTC